jgi:hypothetical protein
MASLLEIFTYPTVAGAKHYCRRLHAFKGVSLHDPEPVSLAAHAQQQPAIPVIGLLEVA